MVKLKMYVLHIRSMRSSKAFDFHVINIDGNDFDRLKEAFDEASQTKGKADGDHRQDRQGKRCFLYGESGKLAWNGSER